jgi:hypothetical protein
VTAYILGAGCSAQAGYPLASGLLRALSEWLDHENESDHWIGACRNRIVQVRETFGSLDDFEGILGKLEEYGYDRVRPTAATTPVSVVGIGLNQEEQKASYCSVAIGSSFRNPVIACRPDWL